MNRRSFLTTAAAAGLAPMVMSRPANALALDYSIIEKIKAEGLGLETSQVMKNSSYMLDVIGPRLTASPGAQKSGEWVVSKLKEWGLTGAELEPWMADATGGNNGFPSGWQNDKFYCNVTAPVAFPLSGMSMGWTPGTNGLAAGECVLVTETAEADVRAKWAGKLRGKWVFGQAPIDVRAQWDPVARRYTEQQLDNMETPARGPEFGTTQPARPTPPRPAAGPPFNRNNFFRDEGALGVFSTNKSQGVINVFGGANRNSTIQQIPQIVIIAEHYGRIARTLMAGQTVRLEADIRNSWVNNPMNFNVVGEIKGKEKPDEVVIIGGHFDSFAASTGATDNGGNCVTAMEAMRILKAINAPLKRTVRICLWTGEEQGLIGSRLYVAKHFGGVRGAPTARNARGEVAAFTKEHQKFQAYFNLDNGCGAIRGVYAQSNSAMIPIFREWGEPFRDIGFTHVTPRNTGSTDHASFDAAGLPGFQFIQDPIDYEPKTHHTNMDYYESLQPEDMRRNSTILAGMAFLAANHPDKLPRKAYVPPRDPTPPAATPAPRAPG